MIRIALIASCLAAPAAARSPIAEVLCEPTEQIEKTLTRQFGEKRAATGIRSPDEVLEVWTGQKGSWSLVMRYATGTSCIVAMGEDWIPASVTDGEG